MTLEQLKALLDEGKLTQEQFDALAAMLAGGDGDPGDDGKAGDDAGQPADGEGEAKPAPDIETLVQKAVDRATTKLGQDNKALRETITNLERQSMSAEERKKAELKEKEDALTARETELLDRENRLYAVKALKAAGLDDGDERSLDLIDLVLGSDADAIDKNVAALAALVKARVQADVSKLFKGAGGTPQKAAPTATGEPNPWRKDTYNMTEQAKIELEDPARAKALMAAAGVDDKNKK